MPQRRRIEAAVGVKIVSGQPQESGQSTLRPASSPRRSVSHATKRVGAVVIGGDFQGLGIVRSLGRRGVPVCVIDDERSIARYSRYTTHTERVANLHDERRTVDIILDVGRRRGLEGWVLTMALGNHAPHYVVVFEEGTVGELLLAITGNQFLNHCFSGANQG
ncbi:MAG TPA: hypothetical protein VEU97_03465, partial [Ktedonobacteraceae bacterium]|nr:hypothetical protein [Ktedonobacteraceae bacterium]